MSTEKPQRPLAVGDVSKNRKAWRNVRAVAEQRLSGLGGVIDWSPHDYEVMRWVAPSLVLAFYQHKTSAGNYHIRVRAAKCEDRKLLRKAIHALAENSCTFQFPTEREFHNEGVTIAVNEGRRHTQ